MWKYPIKYSKNLLMVLVMKLGLDIRSNNIEYEVI